MTTEHQNNQLDLNQATAPEDTRADRSFDTIADHFEKKVYGGLKGEIRLAVLRRDIVEYSAQMSEALGRPLRILDVGAGLAQIAIEKVPASDICQGGKIKHTIAPAPQMQSYYLTQYHQFKSLYQTLKSEFLQ